MPVWLVLAAFAGAVLAGVVAHEVAHWAVWKAGGRAPVFGLREVRPRAGPRETIAVDRVAAAAPYALGLVAVLSGLWAAAAGTGFAGVVWAVFGAGMVARPSRADWDTMRGRTEWRIDESAAES